MRKHIYIFVTLLFLTIPFLSMAGGPFFVDPNGRGTAFKWENNTVKWMIDGGPLNSKFSNDQAVGWFQELFGLWQSVTLETSSGEVVPVVDLKFEYAGSLETDINGDNYKKFIKWDEPTAVVMLDEDGSIIDDEMGEGSHKYIVGFASPFGVSNSEFISGGVVVINGLFMDGDAKNSGELSERAFKAAIFHEIGHLLNLDHTQANIEVTERVNGGDFSLTDEIPTMYPILYTEDQLTPHADDIIALAQEYPSEAYLANFCDAVGELTDSDGNGFQGADVVARAKDLVYEWSDVRTFVSGVLYPPNTTNGNYILGGIVPGREYVVGYRGIDSLFTRGSSLAPYDPPRSGIDNGEIGTISCSKGGDTIKLDTVKPSTSTLTGAGGENVVLDPIGSAAQPSGGCSLIR